MTPPQEHAPHRLGDVPLFAGLSTAALEELERVCRSRRYPAGQIIWSEGDPGESLLVLEEGHLRVSRFTTAGAEVVLAVVEPPTALGELALLDGRLRDASVIAQGPVTVRLVSRHEFLALIAREPAVAHGLLTTLADWVRHGNQRHTDLLGLDVPGRLAKWLLGRAGNVAGVGVPAGTVIELGRSQGELAAELGTTRESLNRALRGFCDAGLAMVDGERVTLLNPAELVAYLD